ncbi:hypothetical protein [Mycobacterium sp.]|uniref:hypothetical protein n=1 Tax=Mycobacterium sp. TaxID=1785 RepID=UPI002D0AEA4F|nr:hypothetical protein [Mycobacterium sp.]HTQ21113.1 hypothetical protein [Mycobacterium sp.]
MGFVAQSAGIRLQKPGATSGFSPPNVGSLECCEVLAKEALISLQSNVTGQLRSETDVQPSEIDDRSRPRVWVNWVLAWQTVPAAVLVMIFGIGAAMSVAACSEAQCPKLGPSGLFYGVLLYGAPLVAALTIAASFLTAARRRWGFIVPAFGLALLLADVAIMVFLFRT